MDKIYLDSASTTYVNHEVLMEMLPMFTACYGNTNSLHSTGREAMAKLDESRARIKTAINAKKAKEVYFTSGGTEANNLAILGIARANKNKGKHIVVSEIEHDSILEACEQLKKEGFKITYVPADKYGIVSLSALMRAMTTDTILVSVMFANNEVGTIQNIKAIGYTVKEYEKAVFHCDAVQAFGTIDIDVQDLKIDALTISSHKLYGPKGAGCLFVREGVEFEPLVVGGSQEHNKRGGTVNLPAVVGFGKAVEIAKKNIEYFHKQIKPLRDYLQREIMSKIENVKLNGHPTQRVPHILNVSFECVDNDSLMTLLDLDGIAVSAGSACNSGAVEPSHVLKSMGLTTELAKSAIRFSLTKRTTKEEIDYVVKALEKNVSKLRKISPLRASQNGGVKNV